ncbi:hypothetical protein NFI96_014097 [Prochilodus magdalenae]|nr:hypothetical protein NFI96_014097 [Prochilodus magdalenae]
MKLHLLLLLLSYEHVQVISAGKTPSSSPTLTVQPQHNHTLTCNITNKYEVAWYHLNSELENLTLLIFAEKTRTRKSLPFSYNRNESRYILTTDHEITVANLTVLHVEKDDLGLYFCGTKADWSHMFFARPIRLQFEGKEDHLIMQESTKKGEDADGVSMTERVLMLGGVGLVGLVFLVATVAAGTVVHKRAWRSGWSAGIDSSLRRSGKR